MGKQIRVRFAPSPTGALHMGGARTALFNYLFAKSNQGKFILRIEDTDKERSSKENLKIILDSLIWLGINWDEGPEIGGDKEPYIQSQRSHIYKKQLEKLVSLGQAYPCFCSEAVLKKKREQSKVNNIPYVYDGNCRGLNPEEIKTKSKEALGYSVSWVYRFLNSSNNQVVLNDLVKGRVVFQSELLGDFIITKSDGSPTYNFAVVVDDIDMEITHIIRGDDHLTNTFKQILIFNAFQSPLPIFAHISLILGEDREKLSKRIGTQSILEFKKVGYYPEPLVNHLALLGWSPDDDEVMSKSLLERSFKKINFSKAPAIFDFKRLNYLNGLYLRNLPSKIVLKDFKIILSDNQLSLDHPKVDEILNVLKNYCKVIYDILPLWRDFFEYPLVEEKDRHWVEIDASKNLFKLVFDFFSKKDDAFIDLIEYREMLGIAKENNFKGKNLFMPLRIKLTGKSFGLELDNFVILSYRKEILRRLES